MGILEGEENEQEIIMTENFPFLICEGKRERSQGSTENLKQDGHKEAYTKEHH